MNGNLILKEVVMVKGNLEREEWVHLRGNEIERIMLGVGWWENLLMDDELKLGCENEII